METKIFYDAPRSISIGDIFYVIDARERNDFSSPCRVCNDEKKLTVNGITFDCPVCGGYRSRETVVSVQHFTVATVKVYVTNLFKRAASNEPFIPYRLAIAYQRTKLL